MNNFGKKVSFIWSVADLLRGPYRPNQYRDGMLSVPSIPERKFIASYPECGSTCFDALFERVKTSIATLREYRVALISAVVAGNIGVRGEVEA
ncbi:hypothetical protein L0665_09530 [Methanogenium marinum]|uniref:Uncharacterized protein n=1 Tax=Methanogenium marinum TaxID=348610 RepID=A0A9Q4PXN9_9EURY|nr:hypothetical protein [Methanogenium marinum]MDE4908846.1 hypothetical protein [Methanogenium marinum]